MQSVYYPPGQRRFQILCYEPGSHNMIVLDHATRAKSATQQGRVLNFTLEAARAHIDELLAEEA